MRLNQASDFSLRVLMFLAQVDEPQTVETVSTCLGLAKSHVMKIVAKLSRLGLVSASRGRGGGIKLGKDAKDIRIGDVVRSMEPDLILVDCLRSGPVDCSFLPRCALKPAMREAGEAFLESLNTHTLASIISETRKPRQATRQKSA